MSAFEIEIQVDDDLQLPDGEIDEALRRAAAATLQVENIPADGASVPGLTLLLTSSERIHQMNREYRQVDKPTDVLSFPAEQDVPGMDAYLGDVVLAVPVARTQAATAGHDLLSELVLLTVHGVLHLLGYDHLVPEEKEAMWAVQDQVLARLGVDVRSPA